MRQALWQSFPSQRPAPLHREKREQVERIGQGNIHRRRRTKEQEERNGGFGEILHAVLDFVGM